jgi:hypothetical protein
MSPLIRSTGPTRSARWRSSGIAAGRRSCPARRRYDERSSPGIRLFRPVCGGSNACSVAAHRFHSHVDGTYVPNDCTQRLNNASAVRYLWDLCPTKTKPRRQDRLGIMRAPRLARYRIPARYNPMLMRRTRLAALEGAAINGGGSGAFDHSAGRDGVCSPAPSTTPAPTERGRWGLPG